MNASDRRQTDDRRTDDGI